MRAKFFEIIELGGDEIQTLLDNTTSGKVGNLNLMFKIRRSNLAFDKLNSSDRYIKAEEKLTKNIPSVDHQLHLKYI